MKNSIIATIKGIKWTNTRRTGPYRVIELKDIQMSQYHRIGRRCMEKADHGVIFRTERGLYLRITLGNGRAAKEITISMGLNPTARFEDLIDGVRVVRVRFGNLIENPIPTGSLNAWYAEELDSQVGSPNFAPIDFFDWELNFYVNGEAWEETDEVRTLRARRKGYNDYLTDLVVTHTVTKKWRITHPKWRLVDNTIVRVNHAVIIRQDRSGFINDDGTFCWFG